jgi:hypothetical protein
MRLKLPHRLRSLLPIVSGAVRHNYMLGASALALIIAAAAATGIFDPDGSGKGVTGPAASVALAAPVGTASPMPALVVTYFLVGSAEEVAILKTREDELVHKEFLAHATFEVLLVRTPEEEQHAEQMTEAARVRSPTSVVVVEDLRLR